MTAPNPPSAICPSPLDLAAYLDDSDPEQREVIEAHLVECPACLAALREAGMLLDESVAGAIARVSLATRRPNVRPWRSVTSRRIEGVTRLPWFANVP